MNLEKRLEYLINYIGLDSIPAKYVDDDFIKVMEKMTLKEKVQFLEIHKKTLKMQIERSYWGLKMRIPFENWEILSKYFGKSYTHFYVIISKNDKSEAIERANFDYTLNLFKKKKIDFVNASFKHKNDRIDVVLIHKDDEKDLQFAIDNVYKPLKKDWCLDKDLATKYFVDETGE